MAKLSHGFHKWHGEPLDMVQGRSGREQSAQGQAEQDAESKIANQAENKRKRAEIRAGDLAEHKDWGDS